MLLDDEKSDESSLHGSQVSPRKRARKRYSSLTRQGKEKRSKSLLEEISSQYYLDQTDLSDVLVGTAKILDASVEKQHEHMISLRRIADIVSNMQSNVKNAHLLFHLVSTACDAVLPITHQARLLNVPETTYREHIQQQKVLNPAQEGQGDRRRPRLPRLEDIAPSTDAQGRLLQWSLQNAPVKSGQLNYRALRLPTYQRAYEIYVESERSWEMIL